MIFEVFWTPPAEQELAGAWLAAPDRNSVAGAANRVDNQLRHRPLQIGESRESSVNRIALVPPLGIEYEVIADDARVYVTGVWLIDRQ